MKHVRRHLTYANVMSSVAVFLVVGGGAAFAALGRNTVGTRQLKRNAVTAGKIGPEAVRGGKLAKNAVTNNRIRDNAVSNGKIADNSVSGPKVTAGAIGASQLAGLNVRTNTVVIPDGGTASVSVSCEANEQVIGAGTSWSPDGNRRYTNYVSITGNGAIARGNQFTGSNQTFGVRAYCLSG